MTRTGRPVEKGQIERVKMAVVIVGLEQRLAKGWDYLDEHPAEDRPGQSAYELWLKILTRYQNLCRSWFDLTGEGWTFASREEVTRA